MRIEDREYNVKDYDLHLVIDDRTRVIASKITEFLKNTNRFNKTIVFCVDIEHAERMRQAFINENKDLYAENDKYIMRITGDNNEGKAQLEHFIDEESPYPVIAVTSKLMTTGVDAKMCKLIVLDNNFKSMTNLSRLLVVVQDFLRNTERPILQLWILGILADSLPILHLMEGQK